MNLITKKDISFRVKKILDKDKSLEDKLALIFMYTGTILGVLAVIVTIAFQQPLWQLLIHLSVVFLCLLTVVVSDNFHKNTYFLLIVVGLLYFPFIFITNAGNDGAGPIYFILIVVYLAFYLKNKEFVITISFFIIYYIGLIIFGNFFPEYIIPYEDTAIRYIDIIVAVISVSVVIAIIANKTFKCYGEEHEISIRLMKQLEDQNQKLIDLSIKDQLTGVFNRRYFNEVMMTELNRYKEHKKPFHVMMIDLDDFKKVNDTYGHLFGDEVLRKVAQQISKTTRDYDVIARYGGEEFIVIVSHLNPENSITIAERIRLHVENLKLRNDVNMTVSIGVTANCDSDTLETLVKRADDLMYFAKANGKNCVEYKGCK